MKQDFLNYIQNEFLFSDKEIKDFEESIIKPLKKSIRINTNKISIYDFKKIAEKKWWILTKTNLWKNTFYIDRFEDLNLALWNTIEHINWYFYIQEVAASSSPYFMSWDLIDENPYLILDMSASPWGKTTGISEYYPNSIVVANEINKQRLKWLFVNLDRMWSLNVVSTNYDWKFFTNYEEIFDKVLLDAPCSGEWTAYKTDDSLKYWNLKNIKSIAKLQISLLDSAVKTLKVNWEIVYSTCTLNKIENEWVINEIFKRYEWCLEIVKISENDFIRSWPHIDHTWWFFVVKIKKIKSVKISENIKKQNEIIQNYEKLSSNDTKLIEKFLENNFWFNTKHKKFYKYKNEIFMTNKNIEELWRKFFYTKYE